MLLPVDNGEGSRAHATPLHTPLGEAEHRVEQGSLELNFGPSAVQRPLPNTSTGSDGDLAGGGAPGSPQNVARWRSPRSTAGQLPARLAAQESTQPASRPRQQPRPTPTAAPAPVAAAAPAPAAVPLLTHFVNPAAESPQERYHGIARNDPELLRLPPEQFMELFRMSYSDLVQAHTNHNVMMGNLKTFSEVIGGVISNGRVFETQLTDMMASWQRAGYYAHQIEQFGQRALVPPSPGSEAAADGDGEIPPPPVEIKVWRLEGQGMLGKVAQVFRFDVKVNANAAGNPPYGLKEGKYFLQREVVSLVGHDFKDGTFPKIGIIKTKVCVIMLIIFLIQVRLTKKFTIFLLFFPPFSRLEISRGTTPRSTSRARRSS